MFLFANELGNIVWDPKLNYPLSWPISTSFPLLSCIQTLSPLLMGRRMLFEAEVSFPPPTDTTA